MIAGGPLFTTGHERFPEIQHFVLGEAEPVINQLVADMGAGHVKRIYGVGEKPSLEGTPPPRWDLVRLRDYATMPLQFSRGCPFDCEFCDIVAMYGRTPRTKTPLQFTRELDALWDAGWREAVFIVDDNFVVPDRPEM